MSKYSENKALREAIDAAKFVLLGQCQNGDGNLLAATSTRLCKECLNKFKITADSYVLQGLCEKGDKEPLAKNSTRLCEEHLDKRKKHKKNLVQQGLCTQGDGNPLSSRSASLCEEHRIEATQRSCAYAKKNPEIAKENAARRNAQKRNTQTEKISYHIVYKKYNYTCHICNKKINMSFKYPNPLSKSIDHIVPLAKGGTHTYNNVKPAHLICNVKKNDRII